MRDLGLCGVVREKRQRTTVTDGNVLAPAKTGCCNTGANVAQDTIPSRLTHG